MIATFARHAMLLLAAGFASSAVAGESDLRLGSGVDLQGDHSVRRYEWVVMVRTSTDVPDALGRAEIAAGRAGGAVLAEIRMDAAGAYADHRLLIRTLDRETIGQVVARIRVTRGVVGATSAPLPETPTWAGSPGFMESYVTPDDSRPSNAGRVLVRHDVPPVADARELLEAADVVAGPGLPPLEDGMGGFTLNVSEIMKRIKESTWRKREARLRATPIVILEDPPVPAE